MQRSLEFNFQQQMTCFWLIAHCGLRDTGGLVLSREGLAAMVTPGGGGGGGLFYMGYMGKWGPKEYFLAILVIYKILDNRFEPLWSQIRYGFGTFFSSYLKSKKAHFHTMQSLKY